MTPEVQGDTMSHRDHDIDGLFSAKSIAARIEALARDFAQGNRNLPAIGTVRFTAS